jgi:alpha-1,3-rhamnosyl/mannosyltransferase
MRIALDCTPSASSIGHGIGVYARNLVDAVARHAAAGDRFDLGYESRRWHARGQGISELDARFTHRRLWPLPLRFGWAAKVDVFHALEARLPRSRFRREVVTFHDMYPFHRCLWQDGGPDVVRYHTKRLERYPEIAERAAAIICVSQSTRDDLLKIAPFAAAKAVVIPHGTDAGDPCRLPRPGDVPSAVEEAAQGRFFVHVGSTWRIRNLPATVRAFSCVARAHPDVRLVIVGEDGEDTDKVRSLASQLRIGSSVLIMGMLPEPEKLFLVSRAAALLMFHLYAGFGLPILEAMALGVPILASDRGALPEIGGDAGVYVQVDDEEGMAQAMERVLGDGAFARRLSDAGRVRSSGFTWDVAARDTYALYRRLMESS